MRLEEIDLSETYHIGGDFDGCRFGETHVYRGEFYDADERRVCL